MRLVILDDYNQASEWAAKYIRNRIIQFKPSAERYFTLGLPTGSTPFGCYEKLIEYHKNGDLSFKYVKTFNMDEYVGLPRDHPESYHSYMWNNFFKHIDIDPANVSILDGNVTDLEAECEAFEKTITQAGGIDLFVGGIGPDGHIAFNEPGSSLVSRTRVKTLAKDTIVANARFFGNDLSKVPTMALTVGVGTVMDAREVMILITGAHKAFALYKAIEEGLNHMWTVSAFQQHPRTIFVCDEDATLELRVKTVKYFKDMIAIPDFGTGAMENWGLITYREANLLYDENQSSSHNKERVASVIAHELVHQWFGNIVTMDWWDDLWLNEGFASFFEYIGVEKAEPTWGMRDIMIISDVLPVMVDDALVTSHPIIVSVSTPAEITSVFDGISYSKGASLLRMVEDWMGRDTFRDGCRNYLKKFQFDNAKTDDFWESLANVSRLPVADVMNTWTKQMGYPVVNLSTNENRAQLTQQRFLLDPNADPGQPTSPVSYKWTIPVKWHSLDSNKNMLIMFNKSSPEVVLDHYSLDTDGLLKVNNDHIGFYRVNHHESIWSTISQKLQTNLQEFDAADRCSYIDDVFALARADIVDYGNSFNLTKYLRNETEYIVWERVSSSIAYVRDMLSDDTVLYPKFQKMFHVYVYNISRQLGWTDVGSQRNRLLRETVLGIACQMGDEEHLNEASDIFDQWIAGKISVEVNLRLLVYRYGMRNSGTEEKWNIMFERYKTETLAQEKDKLLYGLASVENITLLHNLLEASKDDSIVRTQDLFTVVRYVSLNRYGKTMAWDWVTLNWDFLVNRYTINDRNLGRLLTRISTTYNTELQLWQMEYFFKLNPNAGAGEMPRQQALETVKNNIEWVRRNKAEISLWLESNVP